LISRTKRPRWMTFIPSLAVLLVLLHLLLEGYRLPMIPAYGLTIVFFFTTNRNILGRSKMPQDMPSRGRRILTTIAIILSWLFFIIAGVLPAVLPVFQLPKPTGPYSVGCTHLYFIDKSRSESFTSDHNDFRQIWARIWYPATLPGEEDPMSYMEKDAARALARWWGLPFFVFDGFALVKTHSYLDASIFLNSRPFPIIFFNHGYQVAPHLYTVMMEELASQGYVVFSVGHAYETPFFRKPDGEYILFNPQNKKRQLRLQEGFDPVREQIMYDFPKTNNWQERDSLYKELFRLSPYYNESVRIWAEDVSSLINQIDIINKEAGFFAGKLDPDRIGVAGHSFGGAAAGQATLIDPRIKAGMNIDGLQNGDLVKDNLTRPFMFMASHLIPFSDEDGARFADPFYERSESTSYIMLIKKTKHENFSDLPFMGFLMNKMFSGDINSDRCANIINTYLLAFFDKHLKGEYSPLLNGLSSDYPEVVLWSRN
ncbi:MAG: alpha/beta hydrolase family protein, partial [Planctomycetota bacterium]